MCPYHYYLRRKKLAWTCMLLTLISVQLILPDLDNIRYTNPYNLTLTPISPELKITDISGMTIHSTTDKPKQLSTTLAQALEPHQGPASAPVEGTNVVVLSTNPRSGSSFLADVLTPDDKTGFYFFEPLRWLDEKPPQNVDRKKKQNRTEIVHHGAFMTNATTEQKLRMIRDFFGCRFDGYGDVIASDYARNNVFRKPSPGLGMRFVTNETMKLLKVVQRLTKRCHRTKLRLIKTIRLKVEDIRSPEFPSDVKVVVLVRDPRAVLSSMLQSPWKEIALDFREICANILAATAGPESLPKNAILVRYEDLMLDAKAELRRVSGFIGIDDPGGVTLADFDEEEMFEARLRKRRRIVSKYAHLNKFNYYGTVREANFSHDSWRQLLPTSDLEDVQSADVCQEAFVSSGYTRVYERSNITH